MIPDDTAGRPLTPGEQAAIADLERRFLLDTAAPVRERLATRPVRVGPMRSGSTAVPQAVAQLLALLGTAILLVALTVAVGGGPLGAAAVLAGVVGTALVWPLLPPALGGPVRPRRRLRTRGPLRRR